MDDVDGTQGQIAKTMLQTGNWVTAHLDGVPYLEKAPLKYWITATLYSVLGVHDWVARVPNGLAVILLCLLVYRMGVWAGSERTGFYGGLALATSIGLFLFTRIVIPDVILTLAITLAVWSFARIVESDRRESLPWAGVFYASIACGVLLKGLIGIVFPVGICATYALLCGVLFSREMWKKLRVARGMLLFIAIAAPWHILAILHNPPYFDLTLHADPNFGHRFRGFFWFYFINDQFLRFTNGRWPHDYNTVPRIWFWLYHLLWFFPWSFLLVGLKRSRFRTDDRLGRLHILCLITIGVIMGFFSLSTTQEYYSMPIYPALALLIGSAMNSEGRFGRIAARCSGVITGVAFLACSLLLIKSWGLPTPGDISDVLSKQQSEDYTLALDHIADLTFAAFAYLRVPLAIAAAALFLGTLALWSSERRRRYFGAAVMLVIFLQAARLAMVAFDPYLSSYAVADALNTLPKGQLVLNGEFYRYSSVGFYTDYKPYILNGRINNLEYGSYAPDTPQVFIDDRRFLEIWKGPALAYIITYDEDRKSLEKLVGASQVHRVMRSGGKQLLANMAVTSRTE
ncbi:MAG: Polymyxin resistance protein ArnT [Bryobacterales bacterium]|nr:Polymyxin resistance protein ArnT [Bryobacterales bacterium]